MAKSDPFIFEMARLTVLVVCGWRIYKSSHDRKKLDYSDMHIINWFFRSMGKNGFQPEKRKKKKKSGTVWNSARKSQSKTVPSSITWRLSTVATKSWYEGVEPKENTLLSFHLLPSQTILQCQINLLGDQVDEVLPTAVWCVARWSPVYRWQIRNGR